MENSEISNTLNLSSMRPSETFVVSQDGISEQVCRLPLRDEFDGEVHGPLSVEEAQSIELPSFLHPIERIRMIGRLASETCAIKPIGFSLHQQLAYTRRGLVKFAQMYENDSIYRDQVAALRQRLNALHTPSEEGIIGQE